jgi:hypothetical protein
MGVEDPIDEVFSKVVDGLSQLMLFWQVAEGSDCDLFRGPVMDQVDAEQAAYGEPLGELSMAGPRSW